MNAVLGIIGAAVGAGFASGREIMQFFSRWGAFSWALAAMAACCMAWLMCRIMAAGRDERGPLGPGNSGWIGQAPLLLLLTAVGGSMTAAAGELAALTLPLRRARSLGGLITLAGCAALSRKPLDALGCLGKLLFPVLITALILGRSVPGSRGGFDAVSAASGLGALLQAAGYSGMNAALAAGVLRDAGKGRSRREILLIGWSAGGCFFLLLALGNLALLPHAGELKEAALPMVMLLRHYGKTGYWLMASVLYLAVATTLIAALHGLRSLLPVPRAGAAAFLLTGASSLIGFQGIVASAYPALGWLCLLFLIRPGKMRIPG